MIESSSNAQIKRIKKLKKNARYRREEGVFVVEGWKMTDEALKHRLARVLYVSEAAEAEWKLRYAENDFGELPVEWISDSLFRELSDTVSPQGIITLVEMPEYDIETMTSAESASLLLLEDIRDPGNLGTMIRTAEGAGMSGVLLSKGCVDIFNPKVVRSTMGAMFRVPYFVCSDFATEVENLKKQGFHIYAAHLSANKDYTLESFEGKTGILIGNEAKGLSDYVSSLADVLLKIPMEGELESLNAAVSAALFMYEIHRKR